MMSRGLAELGVEDTEKPTFHVIGRAHNSARIPRIHVSTGWSGVDFPTLVLLQPEVAAVYMSVDEFVALQEQLGVSACVNFKYTGLTL